MDAGDVDDTPSQSPKLHAQIKPNYRQRKVRKTGLSTVELQKAMPELSDFMSAERSSLATYVQLYCLRDGCSYSVITKLLHDLSGSFSYQSVF